jgi:hypothetical protein
MRWDPTHILWGQQVLLMWILLPPIFIAAALIPFGVPLLLNNRKKKRQHDPRQRPETHAVAEHS